MAGQSLALFGWSWTEVSVLGSQVFGQASMEGCDQKVDMSTHHCMARSVEILCYKFVCLITLI